MTDKITSPGIYDLTPEQYHREEPCAAPSISSSGLRTLLNQCPSIYWWDSPLNPERPEEETKAAFSLGKAAHDYILRRHVDFLDLNYVLSEGCKLNTNKGKAERDEQLEAGKNVIPHAAFVDVKGMAAALDAHEFAGRAFVDGLPERTLAWQDKETGVWLRCRPDWLPNALLFVPDYKTSISSKPEKFVRHVWDFGYHQQSALYVDGIEAVTGEKPRSVYFVVQEKVPPYVVTCIALDSVAIDWGRIQNRKAVHEFARCLETDNWPGYADDVVEMSLPIYAERELERMHEHGRFDTEEEKTT